MSSKLYNPKNQWGKSLVPVATPKSKTGTPDNEFIDPSWLDTVDSLEPTEEKKLVSSDALKEVAEKFEQNQAEHEQFKKDIKQNNLLAGTVAEHLADTKTSLEEAKQTIAANEAANKAQHQDLQEQITNNNLIAGTVAEHLADVKTSLQETNQKITDNEVANENKHKELQRQISTNNQIAGMAIEKAVAVEQTTNEIKQQLAAIEKGEVSQNIITVTITEGESNEIDWKDGTSLISCTVNGDFFIPHVSLQGQNKAKLVFFSPAKQPENFSAPQQATVVLLQPNS